MIVRALLLIAASALAAPAAAQDASSLLEEGLSLRREGRDAEAAERFRAAYAIDRSARSLAQVGLAEQAAGDWVAAERDLAAAMAMDDPWVAEHRGVLESALAAIRSQLGRLHVVSNVEGAEVWIDGRRAAALPMSEPISAAIGTVVVEVRAPGHLAVQRSATIRTGELSRLRVDLVRQGGEAREAATTEPIDRSGVSPIVIGGAITAGVAVLAFAGTMIAVGVREAHVAQWNDDTQCPEIPPDGRMTNCAGVWSTLRTAEDWAIAGGIVSGVLAVASGVLIGVGASEDTRVSVRASPSAIGLDVRARF